MEYDPKQGIRDREKAALPDLKAKLSAYVDAFNTADEELYTELIPNRDAFAYLADQIPLLECPDKTIEQTYYFRWWTLRKHWKDTPDGHILTEFLPPVGWAGPYNSINCPVGHHIRESRWLRDPEGWVRENIRFWMDKKGRTLAYSAWYASVIEDMLNLHPDPAFEAYCLDRLIALYGEREEISLHPCGLFWSEDGWDGGELSISGSGLRPTMNAYMCGDAMAISRMAARQGHFAESAEFARKAERIREKMDALLWDGDFYKVLPCGRNDEIPDKRPPVPPENDVREELGFIPWYFGIPGPDKSAAFRQLTDEEGFAAPYGITTAERRHPRFMFKHPHECLWNGPVWPFATSQTLTALARHLREHGEAGITKKDYVRLLTQYAASHRLVGEDGRERMWIDEDMDPFTGEWIARRELKADNWNPGRGGVERGKDYNHSTFCDLVLSGLLGIDARDGRLTVDPLIPDDWDWFCVTNLPPRGETVLFDRTGERYGLGAGLLVLENRPNL
ncbi:MAG: hypothetical protein IKX19_05000 [Clostridia bacterium]|nr:hypothetical protein [Clostridia bacterium]